MNHLSPNVPGAWKPAARRAEAGLKVLVVDDNVDAAEILAEALELFGYEVSVCHDGAEALRIAARMRPDVGILDIGLPEMDGTELARRLKRDPLHQDLRLIAATGYGGDSDRALTTDAGFEHHIVKPLSLDELVRLIGRKDA